MGIFKFIYALCMILITHSVLANNMRNKITHYKEISEITNEDVINQNIVCSPNQSYKVDCNTCVCNNAGDDYKHCTRMVCTPKKYAPLKRNKINIIEK